MALPSLGNPWRKASTSFPCMYMRYILFIFLQVQRSVGRGEHPYLKIRKPRIWQCLQEWPGTEVPAVQYKEDLEEWWVKETLQHKARSPYSRVTPRPPELLRHRGRFAYYRTASIPCTGPHLPGETPGEDAGIGFGPLQMLLCLILKKDRREIQI